HGLTPPESGYLSPPTRVDEDGFLRYRLAVGTIFGRESDHSTQDLLVRTNLLGKRRRIPGEVPPAGHASLNDAADGGSLLGAAAGRGLVVDGSIPTMVRGPLSSVLVLWAGRSFVGKNALVSRLSSHRQLGAFSRPICSPRRPRPLTGGPGHLMGSAGGRASSVGQDSRSSIGPQSSSDRHWRRM
ncbi:hypothetical protein THAOC_13760, partial [Thalassiosira oceanica]